MTLSLQEEESPFPAWEGRRRWPSQETRAEKRCTVKSRGIISSTAMAMRKEATMTVMVEPVVIAWQIVDKWGGFRAVG